MKKNDIILFVSIILVSLIALAVVEITKKAGESVVVTVDGEKLYEYSLDKDGEYEIKTEYGTNTLKIENGQADIICADCKNQICVNSAPIKKSGEAITCLPHRLTVKVNGKESDLIS